MPVAAPAATVARASSAAQPTPPRPPAPLLSPSASPSPSPSPAPQALSFVVTGTGTNGISLERRQRPTGKRIKVWPDGSILTSLSESREVSGRTWRRVRDPDDNEGWAAADFLVGKQRSSPEESGVATAQPTAAAADTAEPKPSGAMDCARFESSVVTPGRKSDSSGSEISSRVALPNCGTNNWSSYRVVRTEGTFGPETIQIGNWPPGTTGTIWLRGRRHPALATTVELSDPWRVGCLWRLLGRVRHHVLTRSGTRGSGCPH